MDSDIPEGKYSWLYVKALELYFSNVQQLHILKETYGKTEPKNISSVKVLYFGLGLSNEFLRIQQEMYADIKKVINNLNHPLSCKF